VSVKKGSPSPYPSPPRRGKLAGRARTNHRSVRIRQRSKASLSPRGGWGEGKSNKTKFLSPTHNNWAHSLGLPVRRVRAKPPERLRRRKDQGRWGQRPSPLGGMLSSASHYFSSRRANEQLLLLRRKRGRRPLPFQTPISLIQWQCSPGERVGVRASFVPSELFRLRREANRQLHCAVFGVNLAVGCTNNQSWLYPSLLSQ